MAFIGNRSAFFSYSRSHGLNSVSCLFIYSSSNFLNQSLRIIQYSNLKNKYTHNLITKYPKRYCHIEASPAVKKKISEIKNVKPLQKSGPGLDYFISNLVNPPLSKRELKKISHPYIKAQDLNGHGQKVFFKVYGCQMNSNDVEVAWSILKSNGYCLTSDIEAANIILLVTCAIREGAETKVWRQLEKLRSLKNKNKETKKNIKIGVLGCMAERIGSKIIDKEQIVDVVAGPDSYKDLPRLLAISNEGEKSINILLSHDETYANVNPVSLSESKISAYVSIMRGCDNMCSYCIVPFTRGRERSRNIESILDEVKYLSAQGIKEVTLLGQNVNSYRDMSEVQYVANNKPMDESTQLAKGFKSIYKNKSNGKRFADLLDKVSLIDPEMRIRFTSPHPKDFPDEVLHIIKDRPNICNNLHLPAQSGNTRILELMQRGYTREAYLDLVWHIRSILPSVCLSSDFICGFCSETEEEFMETLTLMKEVRYNLCYVFPYSMREKTSAHRNLTDDVPHHNKIDRLKRMSSLFREIALKGNLAKVGEHQLVLVEGSSKRSALYLAGRNDGNTKVIFPDLEIPESISNVQQNPKPGDYVRVVISDASSQVLKGTPMCISSIKDSLAW